MSTPVFTLIAGANGAGKSTLTGGNPDFFNRSALLDPDTFAKPLSSTSTAAPIAAGREVLRLARECLEQGRSFSIETTLFGKNYLEMMLSARCRGFETLLDYIGTDRVEINLSRIAKRVAAAGTMFLTQMSADAMAEVSRTFQSPPIAPIKHWSLTTQRSRVTNFWVSSLLC